MAGEKVLLVDDEQEFAEALSERLRMRDMQVDIANEGAAAVAMAGKQRYDVIILDLAMPGMDGIETLRALKESHPDLQIILLTGHGTLQKGVEAMKLGAMDFLEKPADLGMLLSKIRAAKEKGDQADADKTREIISEIVRTKGW